MRMRMSRYASARPRIETCHFVRDVLREVRVLRTTARQDRGHDRIIIIHDT